jgi:hypothetical protein
MGRDVCGHISVICSLFVAVASSDDLRMSLRGHPSEFLDSCRVLRRWRQEGGVDAAGRITVAEQHLHS